jgi:hypothetical protein
VRETRRGACVRTSCHAAAQPSGSDFVSDALEAALAVLPTLVAIFVAIVSAATAMVSYRAARLALLATERDIERNACASA